MKKIVVFINSISDYIIATDGPCTQVTFVTASDYGWLACLFSKHISRPFLFELNLNIFLCVR